MTIKTLAVILFDSAEADWLLSKTADLASALGAHVIGLHSYSPVVFFDGMNAAPIVFATLQDWEEQESDKIRATFDEVMRRNDLRAEFRRQEVLYGGEEFLLAAARGADLVIMGTNGTGRRSPDDQGLAERLIRNLGRPVLVFSPEAKVPATFTSLTIGWSETREATRAAHDALALAADGARVELVSLVAKPEDDLPGFDSRDDFAAALDRRGFAVTTTNRTATRDDRGEELLQAAADSGADLLVAGAFGHSLIYDFVIGAVTRHLLRHATLPVLFSR